MLIGYSGWVWEPENELLTDNRPLCTLHQTKEIEAEREGKWEKKRIDQSLFNVHIWNIVVPLRKDGKTLFEGVFTRPAWHHRHHDTALLMTTGSLYERLSLRSSVSSLPGPNLYFWCALYLVMGLQNGATRVRAWNPTSLLVEQLVMMSRDFHISNLNVVLDVEIADMHWFQIGRQTGSVLLH